MPTLGTTSTAMVGGGSQIRGSNAEHNSFICTGFRNPILYANGTATLSKPSATIRMSSVHVYQTSTTISWQAVASRTSWHIPFLPRPHRWWRARIPSVSLGLRPCRTSLRLRFQSRFASYVIHLENANYLRRCSIPQSASLQKVRRWPVLWHNHQNA